VRTIWNSHELNALIARGVPIVRNKMISACCAASSASSGVAHNAAASRWTCR
jgi:hypothetical protein